MKVPHHLYIAKFKDPLSILLKYAKTGYANTIRDMLISKIPSSKLGLPKDVAYAAAFLSSDLSNYITGETLHVNGGLYLG